MRYLDKNIKYVEAETFQSVYTDLHWSEPLTICLVKSNSALLEVFCLLKSEQILVLYITLSLFSLGSTEITAATQDQVFTADWSLPCPTVSI